MGKDVVEKYYNGKLVVEVYEDDDDDFKKKKKVYDYLNLESLKNKNNWHLNNHMLTMTKFMPSKTLNTTNKFAGRFPRLNLRTFKSFQNKNEEKSEEEEEDLSEDLSSPEGDEKEIDGIKLLDAAGLEEDKDGDM